MNNSDFKETSEKYKNEMMRLYSTIPSPPKDVGFVEERSLPSGQADNSNEQISSSEVKNLPAEQEDEQSPEQQTTENANADMPIEKRFPPPVLPDFIRETPKPAANNSFGFLKVTVKTGNGGIPVQDSVVTVSEMKNGQENILYLLNTDESGVTKTVKLSAPENSKGNSPEDYQSFAKYNISVYSKGFFREVSVDAPIFAGVTSIQNFYLIPEPFDYNSGERTIVDRNPEPSI